MFKWIPGAVARCDQQGAAADRQWSADLSFQGRRRRLYLLPASAWNCLQLELDPYRPAQVVVEQFAPFILTCVVVETCD